MNHETRMASMQQQQHHNTAKILQTAQELCIRMHNLVHLLPINVEIGTIADGSSGCHPHHVFHTAPK